MLAFLDIMIERVDFENSYMLIPNLEVVDFCIRFSDILHEYLVPSEMLKREEVRDLDNIKGNTLYVKLGKTTLIRSTTKALMLELKKNSLEVSFEVNRELEATSVINWTGGFINAVKNFEEKKNFTSFSGTVCESLLNQNSNAIGTIVLFLRLSCIGTIIEYDFQFEDVTEMAEVTFVNQKTKAKLYCKNLEPKQDNMTVPLTGLVTDNVSYTSVYLGKEYSTELEINGAFDNYSSDDILSMCARPPENKFFNVFDLVFAEVTTGPDGTVITMKKGKPKKKVRTVEKLDQDHHRGSIDDDNKYAKSLCGKKDCPAAKKFKDYGIGPLATGKGLGTIYNDVKPDVTYKMSQTYGTLDYYGPFGVLGSPDLQKNTPRYQEASKKIEISQYTQVYNISTSHSSLL